MAKKLVKKQDGGSSRKAERVIKRTTNRVNRLESRADKAQKKSDDAFNMYEKTYGDPIQPKFERISIKQGDKASRLREKSEYLREKKLSKYDSTPYYKKGGSVKKQGGSVKKKK